MLLEQEWQTMLVWGSKGRVVHSCHVTGARVADHASLGTTRC